MQYIVLKECGRTNIVYKVVYKINADEKDAKQYCQAYIHEQRNPFKYYIVKTDSGIGYLKLNKSKDC